ncbi:MAG: response regulator [Bdellovibrionota bacterium]|nr:response regulator [Bdellovibrionota bacterium]
MIVNWSTIIGVRRYKNTTLRDLDRMEKAYSKQPRILIADDLQKNIQVIGTILRKEGFQINVAVNGKQALDLAEKTIPDLILMDIMMPGGDGIETCRKLKEHRTLKKNSNYFHICKK